MFNKMKYVFVLLIIAVGLFFNACGNHVHTMGEWRVISDANCQEAQVLERECTVCREKETKYGESKTEHSYYSSQIIEPTLSKKGYTLFKCDCGDEYKANYTCLIKYKYKTSNALIDQNLIKIDDKIVSEGSAFEEVENRGLLVPIKYETNGQELSIGEAINNSVEITVTWDLKKENDLSISEKNFIDVLTKIKKLESISLKYNEENQSANNAFVRVLQYIRQLRYNTNEWNMFGGTIEADFSNYVLNNSENINVQELQSLQNIIIPATNNRVDFVHMMAVMNVALKNGVNSTGNDLVGWAGDLLTLAIDVKNSSLIGTNKEKAESLFLNNNSSFSSSDFFADLDAINITAAYGALNAKSISNAMLAYYNQLTNSNKKSSFLKNVFNDVFLSENVLEERILERISNNFAIKFWCNKNNLNFELDGEVIGECINVFAKYMV